VLILGNVTSSEAAGRCERHALICNEAESHATKKTTQTLTTDISTSLPTTSLSVKLLHFGFKSWQALELQLYFTSNRPVYISLLQMSNNDVSPLFISCSKSRQYRAFKVLLQHQNVAFYDIPLM